ncbi:hypothetical protein FisN_2Hh016 [Fistulifera solaris]|jgi:phytanoyl-CoA hydroxylase|uniref:Phytanoyl-CoA dioxygenase n=1 Tax=Fistulifera solaris TaxID=1519565 RepID=A0A1Z5KDU9_FISSO|nr:hypothetical protein FisN_2Hh016 [Fistulifera solaris]|eukprot:GAX24490.1 hypothetical protein FisN_2Hh016 [Fistulifera solaris]
MKDVHQHTAETIQRLEQESLQVSVKSWLDDTPVSSTRSRFFHHAGFLHLPNFVDTSTCYKMKECMQEIVNNEWDTQQMDSFGTSAKENTARGDYFLESAARVHFFAEPSALDDNKQLKAEFQENKIAALNKVGHGLHLRQGPFSEYAFSVKISELMSELGWNDPLLPQSMYIFKQAVVGGAVNSHQDSTFLFTEPRQSCCGLWLALDEATTENGCLWVRPKSHREAVRRQYARNSARESDPSAPQFLMKELYEHSISWDGGLPGIGSFDDLMQAGFIAVPCQPGDLLVFSGELDHLSLPNKSSAARHTFQLHLIEGKDTTWSASNWLQYENPSRPFPRLHAGLDQFRAYEDEN